jgi:adenine phosphoribosyltransferase
MSKKAEKVDIKKKLRRIPEFKGVVFWDITPILKDKELFRESIKQLADHYRGKKIDIVVSNEARGFIIGAPLASRTRKSTSATPSKFTKTPSHPDKKY